MFLTLLIAFLSLIVLMIIHEFGHFVIAKKFGVKVEEFGIGYPPRIFGKKFGETIYSINWVPLGAFVRIYGEEGPEPAAMVQDTATELKGHKSFSALAVWKRILIVLGGVLAFWLASIVIFSVVFAIGASVPIGDQDVPGITSTNIKILLVQENSPAQLAGLKPGDMIVSAAVKDGAVSLNKVADFQNFVLNNKGQKITLTITRGQEHLVANLVPRVTYPEGQGPTGVVLERFANIIEKYPWYEAPIQGTLYTGKITWQTTTGIYDVLSSLFKGKGVPEGAELAGPIGITIFLSRAADYGMGFFLYFIGALSVLLALFNLFPIPALDGGKLLFLVIEQIKGKPVSAKIEQTLTVVFFVLLISMSLFVTIRFDIPRVMDFWRAGS